MNASAGLAGFLMGYQRVRGPLVSSICVFGIVANVLTTLVFTRTPLRQNPTFALLSGLSVAQLLLLANFLVYTLYSNFLDGECAFQAKTYYWLAYLLLNVNLNLVFNSIALVHTSLLGVFRYLLIRFPTRRYVTLRRVQCSILLVYISVPVVCSSFYFNSEVMQSNLSYCDSWEPHLLTYHLQYRKDTPGLVEYNFWIFGIVGKLVPCTCLAFLSIALVWELKKAERRRRNLTGSKQQIHRQRLMTTLILLLILFFFIAVELPQGVLNVLSAVLDEYFRKTIYLPLGDFFEMLTVLYSSINFILYCAMSSEFRQNFRLIFCSEDAGQVQRVRYDSQDALESDGAEEHLMTHRKLQLGSDAPQSACESDQLQLHDNKGYPTAEVNIDSTA